MNGISRKSSLIAQVVHDDPNLSLCVRTNKNMMLFEPKATT